MNQSIYLLAIFSMFTLLIPAQVSNQNYVRTRTMQGTGSTQYIDDIQYYDGLGRPFIKAQKDITGNTSLPHLLSLQEYDIFGREANAWLPAPYTSDYADISTIKNQVITMLNDSRPYEMLVYESSPQARILQQYGSGTAWSNKPVETGYLTNTASGELRCTMYGVGGGSTLTTNGNYADNQLHVTKKKDEDGHVTYVFTDKLERLILVRQISGSVYHDTYYVYDDRNNLCFVLTPMYQDSANLDLYAYQYIYDSRNRCIEKKLPGSQSIKYIYDNVNQLIFSQDGAQRGKKIPEWTFYLYDILQRLTIRGVCTNANTASAKDLYVTCTYRGGNGNLGDSGYYTNISLTSPIIYNVNYYDNYIFLSLPGFNNGVFSSETTSAQGYLTGAVTSLLDSSSKLFSAQYYDIRGQVVKSISSNHLGGYETINKTYTLTGKPLTVQHNHSGISAKDETYTYLYDRAEQVKSITYKLGNNTITLNENIYDKWGRLETLILPPASTSYSYNIRNWVTQITTPKFTQSLEYHTGYGTPCYNGNISSMTWKAGDESLLRGYKFAYDGLNRLTSAAYGEGNTIAVNNYYTENITGYSKNGSITALQRSGKMNSGSYGLIDNLNLTYNGNQLKAVSDAAVDPTYAGAFNFVNGANNTTEYAYNANGNLIRDDNKSITSISYNFLNLPQQITFANGNKTVYLYDANGVKRQVTYTWAGNTKTIDYCDNIIYTDRAISQILTGQGYVTFNKDTPVHHFFVRDHLGNNRVVLSSSGNVEQVTHYYAFGGIFGDAGTNADLQRYKYNEKELDRMNGLDLYDYGARYYDAALGCWHVMDPMAEKYYTISPHAYCNNNPIIYIDPTGMDWYEKNNGSIVWTEHSSQKELDQNNIKGQYLGQSHVLFSGSRYEKLGDQGYINRVGASTANVTVYGPNGDDDITSLVGFTMTSDFNKYGAISEGLFDANYDSKGKSGMLKSNWVLNNRGEIPTMDNQPNLSPYAGTNYGKSVKTGIFIHSTNQSGYAGGTISTGCLLLAPQDFKILNSVLSGVEKFTVRVTRKQNVIVPLQGVTGVVPNQFIQKTIIRQ